MENNYLSHHGILGQKWGVRRFQNEDGSLTPEGRERKMYRDRTVRAGKTKSDVDGIINTMTSDEKDKLAIDEEGYLSYEQGSSVCKRILKKHGDTPVVFFDVLDDGDTFQLAIGTRSGKEFRGKGYASKAANEGVAWMNKNYSKYGKKKAIWGVRVDNEASIRIAEKNGFKLDKNSYSDDGKWVNYEKRFKHSEGGLGMAYDELVHTLFAEEPLEDDHLEHHGILGQKWGKKNGPPYPLDENDHSAAEKKLNKFTPSGVVAKYKDHKKKVQRQKALKKARATKAANAEAKKVAEEHEAAKQKALQSANAKEIMKYRDELTDAEMRDAVARIGWDETLRKKVKEQNPDTITKAVNVIDKYGKIAGKVGDATGNFTKMYNNIAKVLNTVTDSDWPIVGDDKKGKQEDNNDKPSKKDKDTFNKTIEEATKVLNDAAEKVRQEESGKQEKEEKRDWTVDDKPDTSSSSSASKKETVIDAEFKDVTPERAEEAGRLAVERYLQLEDKRKG